MKFKFIVEGNHPIFRRIDRQCFTADEADNVRKGLEIIGYEIQIKEIKEDGTRRD